MGLCALLQCQNKPACLGEASIQSQLMGDFIHLFTGLQKAIQVRDEDEDDSDDDEEGLFYSFPCFSKKPCLGSSK